MKKFLWLLPIVLITAAGCEQKVENQGNFAKTEEFFKEMDQTAQTITETTTDTTAADAQGQVTQGTGEVTGTDPQAAAVDAALPVETIATPEAANVPINPTINDIQQALQNADLYQGKIDGVLGPKTKKAILDFQSQNNLKADGKVGPKTWGQLKGYLLKTTQTATLVTSEVQETASNE